MSKTQKTAVRLGALLLSAVLAISLSAPWAEVYAESLEDEPAPVETVTEEPEEQPAQKPDETPAEEPEEQPEAPAEEPEEAAAPAEEAQPAEEETPEPETPADPEETAVPDEETPAEEAPEAEEDETVPAEEAVDEAVVEAPTLQAGTISQRGTLGTITWEYYNDGELVLRPTSGDVGVYTSTKNPNVPNDSTYFWPWYNSVNGINTFSITKVSVQGTCKIIGSACGMFYWATEMTEADVSGLDTSEVTDFNFMFEGCKKLESIDLSTWKTGSVTSAVNMLDNCDALKTANVSNWDTSKLEKTDGMFGSDPELENIVGIGQWNTRSLKSARTMFAYCRKLKTIDVSQWNTSNLSDAALMFTNCLTLEKIDLSGWDMSALNSVRGMFDNDTSLKELKFGSGVVDPLKESINVFRSCTSLTELDLSDWDTRDTSFTASVGIPPVTVRGGWFNNCTSLAKVHLGENFSFLGSEDNTEEDYLILPTPAGDHLTGKWMLENTKNSALSPEDLRDKYPSEEAPVGTWVWQYDYDIVFDPNGGEGTMDNQTVGAGDDLTLAANAFTSEKDFLGWATDKNASEPEFTDEQEVEAFYVTATGGETVTLYAIWQKTYTISFDPNGGEGELDDLPANVGQEITLPANPFTNDTEFLGWSTDKNATEPEYADGATVPSLTDDDGNVITLYAIWESIPTYAFTKGMDSVWTKESGVTLDFTVSRNPKNETAFAHFTGIAIDGEAVDESSYTAESGSVNLSLKADYLETLDEGDHTLTALFDDGDAETNFTVIAAPIDEPDTPDDPAPIESPDTPDNGGSDSGNGSGSKNYTKNGNSGNSQKSGKSNGPKTGDESNVGLWVTLLTVSAGAAAAVVLVRAKRKQ